MTTVSGAGTARPADMGSAQSVNSLPLTEAAVILMLRKRSDDLDAQVRGVMSNMEGQTAKSEHIQQQIEALQAIRSAYLATNPGAEGQKKLEEIEVTWGDQQMTADELLNELGIEGLGLSGDDYNDMTADQHAYQAAEQATLAGEDVALNQGVMETLAAAATEAGWDIEGAVPITGAMKVNGKALDALVAKLESESRRLNGDNELQMVRMQSAMQQRSQVITMATQMIKSMGDTNKAIARNVG